MTSRDLAVSGATRGKVLSRTYSQWSCSYAYGDCGKWVVPVLLQTEMRGADGAENKG